MTDLQLAATVKRYSHEAPALVEREAPSAPEPQHDSYDAYFGLGHLFRLFDRQGTFRVSPAGLAFGYYLVRNLGDGEIAGRILDMGTGSGALALLSRGMGAASIAASDISACAVVTAKDNEIENFGDSLIDYHVGDLFCDLDADRPSRFDLIMFNPPGWRTPSATLHAELQTRRSNLDLGAMFYGETVALRFIENLPDFLTEKGRAIVGFNSLVGISDIIERSRSMHRSENGSALRFRLLERIEIPLLFYTSAWHDAREPLLREFERGRREYKAAYVGRGETLHWFYEITEITVKRH